MARKRNSPERPRVEPEIIPPDRSLRQPVWGSRTYADMGGTHRVYVTRLGPFGGLLLMAALVILAAVILVAFLGALLFWIPVIALIVVAAALAGFLRPRRW